MKSHSNQDPNQDLNQLGAQVGQLLKANKQTIAVAESSTGGLISAALLAVPGASNYFRAGGVVYTRQAWEKLLNSSIKAVGGDKPLSEKTALHLANIVRSQLETDWGVGEIGAAGPSGTRYGNPAGYTCIAVVGPGVEETITFETGNDDRVDNMWAFTQTALGLLEQALK
ncbi:MAG: damage-inducible protein [Gammaproteobacteria bacterium]|nr:MAG: damage-inducible protein [Gammaproteobacteria bacterium]